MLHIHMPFGSSALIFAASNDYYETVKALADSSAPLNELDGTMGWTALTGATYNNLSGIVNLLIEAKADVHVPTKKGTTALKIALDNDTAEIAAVLEAAGATAN